jgi:hypothetical protein
VVWEDFAVEHQRGGHVQQINGPRAEPFGVRQRKLGRQNIEE